MLRVVWKAEQVVSSVLSLEKFGSVGVAQKPKATLAEMRPFRDDEKGEA